MAGMAGRHRVPVSDLAPERDSARERSVEVDKPLLAKEFLEREPLAVEGTRKVDVNALFSKLSWRLLPLFWTMAVVNYLDRTNLAFAAIELNRDLNFTPTVYGLGSGLFFTTYATLQVPSNLVLRRVGGPSWLAGIIAAWGTVAVCFALMKTKTQFFILRALLGVAEAGAFPGMWFLLNKFYPPGRITVAFAIVESGIPLSHTMAGPLAAALLNMEGVMGLKGWQWLFILEGIPSLLLAGAILYFLPASPETATVLSVEEREYLSEKMAAVQQHANSMSKTAGVVDDDDDDDSGLETGDHIKTVASGKVSETTRLLSQGSTKLVEGKGTHVSKWMLAVLPVDACVALEAAVRNKYVWYMAMVKFLKDIASFGIIFFAPMIVQALVTGKALDHSHASKHSHHHHPDHEDEGEDDDDEGGDDHQDVNKKAVKGMLKLTRKAVRRLLAVSAASWQATGSLTSATYSVPGSVPGWEVDSSQLGVGRQLLGGGPMPVGDSGVKAALLTSIPFGLAAIATLYNAHRSQAANERIWHTGIPAIVGGLIFSLFPLVMTHSTTAAFICLIFGVMGVNSIAAPSLALLSELAAGAGQVVALPLYNSLGNIGGFVGPFIIGVMLTNTHSFAWPCALMGMCLASCGALVLLLPIALGLPPGVTGSSKPRK